MSLPIRFSQSDSFDSVFPQIDEPSTGLRLLQDSDQFFDRALIAAQRNPRPWSKWFATVISGASGPAKARIQSKLSSLFRNASFVPVASALLKGLSPKDFLNAARAIADASQLKFPEFDDLLFSSAPTTEIAHKVRDEIATRFNDDYADRFLLSTLSTNPVDLEWVVSSKLSDKRKQKLLSALLENASTKDLADALNSSRLTQEVLLIIGSDEAWGQHLVERVLTFGKSSIDQCLAFVTSDTEAAQTTASLEFTQFVLQKALFEAAPNDRRVAGLLKATTLNSLGSAFPARWLAQPKAPAARIEANLSLVLPTSLRADILRVIDQLSEQLISHDHRGWGEGLYSLWAELVRESGDVDRDAQLRAAILSLAFCFKSTELPVSALVVVCFPLVHSQLLLSKGEEDFRSLPALLALPMSFFMDWDRAKAARRDLVEAFLGSNWPPQRLIVAALAAGIEHEVLHWLRGRNRGSDYLRRIEHAVNRLSASERSTFEDMLGKR